jgi:hypothetical protein
VFWGTEDELLARKYALWRVYMADERNYSLQWANALMAWRDVATFKSAFRSSFVGARPAPSASSRGSLFVG